MTRAAATCVAVLTLLCAAPSAAQVDLAFPKEPERGVRLPGRGSFTGARLYAPEGGGPFPAVVLSHTCGPLRQHIFEWAQRFLAAGYVVLVVDHLGPRDMTNNCKDFSVTVTEYAQDDVAGLRHLRSMPLVDGTRIAQVGLSYGAMAGLRLASEKFRTKHVGGERFAAIISLYPQFKVALLEITPPIWRRIQVPESYSFWDLHVALQDAMGWLDYHLHLFRMSKPGTGEGVKIGIPDDDPFDGAEPHLPGWEIPIASYFPHSGVVARYDYDFGDGWQHEVTLEAIVPRQRGQKYPRCLGGARRSPPEDCGGVPGYENLLAVMQDPTHEEYEDRFQWLGGRFDPETFDPQKIKFDDPSQRWQLAFGQSVRPARQPRRTKRSPNNRRRASRARRNRP